MSSRVLVNELHQLIVHRVCFLWRPFDGLRRAVLEMIPHQLARDSSESFLNRRYLREDIRTVPVAFDHLLQPANLSLDTAKSLQICRFDFVIDCHGFAATDGHPMFRLVMPAVRVV